MSAGFSGPLRLTDLDDFITPSQVSNHSLAKLAPIISFISSHQACIKPVAVEKKSNKVR